MTSTELRGIPVVTFGENDPKIPVVVCLQVIIYFYYFFFIFYFEFDDISHTLFYLSQEWWGINEEMKVHAKRIHDQGYFVVVPDLYKGKMALEVLL